MLENMIQKARAVMEHAYSPYSNYKVGVCLEAEDGTLYTGCNIENISYGITICAETAAISALVSAGRKQIKNVVLMGSGSELCTPCGRCRQALREFAELDTPIYACDSRTLEVGKKFTLEELLPHSFGPDHLANKDK